MPIIHTSTEKLDVFVFVAEPVISMDFVYGARI